MDYIFTDNDYRILKSLLDRNDRKTGLTKTNGRTIKEMSDKTKLSTKKVRGTMKTFVECGFVTYGVKRGNAPTYMLTPEGFEELKSIRMNIFGEVEK